MKTFSLFALILFSQYLFAQPDAFPGAEGYGRYTTGGRGGRVIEVTNLNDSGPGSFREAAVAKGARIIIFRLSGTIKLTSELEIKNGDLTIAGQTAPGDGICIKGNRVFVRGDNVIIRYMRFRLGDELGVVDDAITVMNSKNVIIDHCSMSWGIDEVGSFYDNENFTLQWCIISEALNNTIHPKGPHGYGGIWGGVNATFHHNLFANNSSRNPRFNGARTGTTPETELVDFRNNVIYNWEINSSYGGEMGRHNMVANYYKPGPASHKKNRILEPFDSKGRWYIQDNFVEGSETVSQNNWDGGIQGDYSECLKIRVLKPFGTDNVNTESAQDAYISILQNAGAIFPKPDAVDARILDCVKNSKVTRGNGIIDSQNDVGGYPLLESAPPPVDSDKDGIPDEWEKKNNLNPDNPADANHFAPDGYTFIEKYLNEIVEGTDENKNK